MSRKRLDQELVTRGLFPTRNSARNGVRAGYVTVDGEIARKPAMNVSASSDLSVSADAGDYVGRGAYKLRSALESFAVRTQDRSAIDVGSSTGGFTEVLLEAGVTEVVALDVGRNQLHPRLREDRRVRVSEGTNIRDVSVADLDGPFDIVTADLSFISLRAVAADLEPLGNADADWIVLVKPQFEVGRGGLSKDGIVLTAEVRAQSMVDVVAAFTQVGLTAVGTARSPIAGGSGNVEAFLWLRRNGVPIVSADAFKVLADE